MQPRHVVMGLLLLSLCVLSASAFLPEGHTMGTLTVTRESGNFINAECSGRERLVVLGNLGTDAPVVHYLDPNTIGSYTFTHSKNFYDTCRQLAGSDQDLKCMCYGVGLHLQEDVVSHYNMVPGAIEKTFSSNVLVHALKELDFNTRWLSQVSVEGGAGFTEAEVYEITRNAYGPAIDPDDPLYDPKYLQLFIDATGEQSISDDFIVVGQSLKGNRWIDEVYNGKKVTIPQQWHNIWIAITLAGVVMIGFSMFFVRLYGWKPARVTGFALGCLILLIGLFLMLTVTNNPTPLSGKSWIFFNNIGKPVANVFMSTPDWMTYKNQMIDNSRVYAQTLNMQLTDASGLDHEGIGGTIEEGPLNQAESRFKYFAGPLMSALLGGLLIWLFVRIAKK